MKIRYFLAFIILLIAANGYSQAGRIIKGTVIDSTKQTVIGATVKLKTATDSISTTTDANGAFTFQSVKPGQISLTITSIGYDPIRRRIMLDNAVTPVMLKPIVLAISTNTLNTVNVTAINPVKIKEDTLEFNAAAYPVRAGAMVEDVIKSCPEQMLMPMAILLSRVKRLVRCV
jgi:hypothetical protein